MRTLLTQLGAVRGGHLLHELVARTPLAIEALSEERRPSAAIRQSRSERDLSCFEFRARYHESDSNVNFNSRRDIVSSCEAFLSVSPLRALSLFTDAQWEWQVTGKCSTS